MVSCPVCSFMNGMSHVGSYFLISMKHLTTVKQSKKLEVVSVFPPLAGRGRKNRLHGWIMVTIFFRNRQLLIAMPLMRISKAGSSYNLCAKYSLQRGFRKNWIKFKSELDQFSLNFGHHKAQDQKDFISWPHISR